MPGISTAMDLVETPLKSRATKALEWAGRGGLACALPGTILGGILGGRIIPVEGIVAGIVYGVLASGIFGLITFTIVGEFYTEDAPDVQLPPLLRRAQLGMFQSFAGFWIFTFLLRWSQHITLYDPGEKDFRLVFLGCLVCAAGSLKVFVPTVAEADLNSIRSISFFIVRYAGLLFADHLLSLMWRTIYNWRHPLAARMFPGAAWRGCSRSDLAM